MVISSGHFFRNRWYYDYKHKTLVHHVIAFPDDLHIHLIRLGYPYEGVIYTEEELIKMAQEWNKKAIEEEDDNVKKNKSRCCDSRDYVIDSPSSNVKPTQNTFRRVISWCRQLADRLGRLFTSRTRSS